MGAEGTTRQRGMLFLLNGSVLQQPALLLTLQSVPAACFPPCAE